MYACLKQRRLYKLYKTAKRIQTFFTMWNSDMHAVDISVNFLSGLGRIRGMNNNFSINSTMFVITLFGNECNEILILIFVINMHCRETSSMAYAVIIAI